MKAAIGLELIGDDAYEGLRLLNAGRLGRRPSLCEEIRMLSEGRPELRPWVAHLTGLEAGGNLRREFLRYQYRDYQHANSVGSRGIFAYYILDPGLYEVHERTSWKSQRRFFLRVSPDGSKAEIAESEVRACLRSAY